MRSSGNTKRRVKAAIGHGRVCPGVLFDDGVESGAGGLVVEPVDSGVLDGSAEVVSRVWEGTTEVLDGRVAVLLRVGRGGNDVESVPTVMVDSVVVECRVPVPVPG